MAKSFFSISATRTALKEAAPGEYTTDAVEKARELAQDYVKELAVAARQITTNAGRKRVTADEIKMARKFLLK